MSVRIKILAVVYILVLAGIIFLADTKSTQHVFAPIWALPFADKVGHFCLMGGFSFIVNLALNAKSFHLWKLNVLWGSLIVATLVFGEEISQIFVNGRTFDYDDLLADFLGIVFFGELARHICRKKLTGSFFTDKA